MAGAAHLLLILTLNIILKLETANAHAIGAVHSDLVVTKYGPDDDFYGEGKQEGEEEPGWMVSECSYKNYTRKNSSNLVLAAAGGGYCTGQNILPENFLFFLFLQRKAHLSVKIKRVERFGKYNSLQLEGCTRQKILL